MVSKNLHNVTERLFLAFLAPKMSHLVKSNGFFGHIII